MPGGAARGAGEGRRELRVLGICRRSWGIGPVIPFPGSEMFNVNMEDFTDARRAQLVTAAFIGAEEEAKGHGDPVELHTVCRRV